MQIKLKFLQQIYLVFYLVIYLEFIKRYFGIMERTQAFMKGTIYLNSIFDILPIFHRTLSIFEHFFVLRTIQRLNRQQKTSLCILPAQFLKIMHHHALFCVLIAYSCLSQFLGDLLLIPHTFY